MICVFQAGYLVLVSLTYLGCCRQHACVPACVLQLARLWVHECERVFRDRMVNEADMQKFDEFRFAVTKKYFDDCGGISAVDQRPLLMTSFMVSTAEDNPVYCAVPSYEVSTMCLEGPDVVFASQLSDCLTVYKPV